MAKIVYFPSIYEDELVYSVLARMCEHIGYFSYTKICESFFLDKGSIDFEFYNPMNKELKESFTGIMTIEELILNHTMFKWHARFLPQERKQASFNYLVEMKKTYKSTIGLLNYRSKKKLRYCPCCVKEDRERYNECYWHRIHQIEGVGICVKHNCKLVDSSINVHNQLYSFHSCEQEVKCMDIEYISDRDSIEFANYLVNVFDEEMSLEGSVNLKGKIEGTLRGTKYMSSRTNVKYGEVLVKDFNEFIKKYDDIVMETWQISKLCRGVIWRSELIASLGFFLGITSKELCNEKIEALSHNKEKFDDMLVQAKEEGKTMSELALQFGMSSCTIGNVLAKKKGKYRNIGESFDDEKIYPIVKKAIEENYCEENGRPRRITKYKICNELGIYEYKLNDLPMCLKAIEEMEETYEEYWVRCLKWTIDEMKKNNVPMSWRRFRTYTNIRKTQALKVLPQLKDEYKDCLKKVLNI